MPTLYLVATPIGNLEDITFRALNVLRSVSLIAAEDTRTAAKLLTHFDIHTRVIAYFEHSRLARVNQILELLEQGDVAVISEAGMPGLSDPGAGLVEAALARGVRIVPIPGATAVISALVASGLPTDQFVFCGFAPREGKTRRRWLADLKYEPRTLVLLEAPHRLCDALDDMVAAFGDRPMCAARELTKVHEEFVRGSITQLIAHFAETPPRGEFTLVVRGAESDPSSAPPDVWADDRVRERLNELEDKGISRPQAAKQVARESGRDRREVYEIGVEGSSS